EGLVGLPLLRRLCDGDLQPPGMDAGDAVLARPGLRVHGEDDSACGCLQFDHANEAVIRGPGLARVPRDLRPGLAGSIAIATPLLSLTWRAADVSPPVGTSVSHLGKQTNTFTPPPPAPPCEGGEQPIPTRAAITP